MKKKRNVIGLSIMLICSFSMAAMASNIWRLSSKTYVENYHEGGLSDTYVGTVSVYGADWIDIGGKFGYPTYSRITYNVQGDVSSKQVNSTGPDDGKQRVSKITVKDKWNFGAKTTCNYSFGKAGRNTNIQPYTVEVSY